MSKLLNYSWRDDVSHAAGDAFESSAKEATQFTHTHARFADVMIVVLSVYRAPSPGGGGCQTQIGVSDNKVTYLTDGNVSIIARYLFTQFKVSPTKLPIVLTDLLSVNGVVACYCEHVFVLATCHQ